MAREGGRETLGRRRLGEAAAAGERNGTRLRGEGRAAGWVLSGGGGHPGVRLDVEAAGLGLRSGARVRGARRPGLRARAASNTPCMRLSLTLKRKRGVPARTPSRSLRLERVRPDSRRPKFSASVSFLRAARRLSARARRTARTQRAARGGARRRGGLGGGARRERAGGARGYARAEHHHACHLRRRPAARLVARLLLAAVRRPRRHSCESERTLLDAVRVPDCGRPGDRAAGGRGRRHTASGSGNASWRYNADRRRRAPAAAGGSRGAAHLSLP